MPVDVRKAVRARLGESRIHLGHRLGAYTQDEGGLSAHFFGRDGEHRCMVRGDVLIGADGIHSYVRETLYPLSLPRATRHLDVRLAARGEEAGIIGMTRIVVDHVFAPSAVDAMLDR